MTLKAKRIFVIALGVFFVLLGIAGTVLPFLQGILFFAIGLILLSFSFPKIRIWMEKHTIKYPKLHLAVKKVEGWITKVVGEI